MVMRVFDLTQTEIIKSDLLDTIVVPIIDVNELIQVFPNPIVTDFTLKFESKIDRSIDLNIFNATGQDIWSGTIKSNNDLIIPANHLAAGAYYLEVSDADKVRIFKLLKQ